MGSSTSFSAACTTLSRTVEIPSRLFFEVPGFGIIRSRTGSGRKLRAFRSARSPATRLSTPMVFSTCQAVIPSTPADRAPRLPRTRHHATRRKAGSHTRLNRSSNLRRGSLLAHRCSLAWISSTRRSSSYSPGSRSRSPAFTSVTPGIPASSLLLAGSLRHAGGFPAPGLLRSLRPAPRPSAGTEPAHPGPGGPGAGRPRAVPTFTICRSTG